MLTLILNTTERVKPLRDNNVLNIAHFTVPIPVSLKESHIPLSHQAVTVVLLLINAVGLTRSACWKER